MSINNSGTGEYDSSEIVQQTADGDLSVVGTKEKKVTGKVDLDLEGHPFAEITAAQIEKAGKIAGLLSINSGEGFPLDMDRDFLEKITEIGTGEKVSDVLDEAMTNLGQ